jgi:hypothetical protein
MILNPIKKLYRKLRGGVWYLIITQERAKHVPHSYTFWHRGVFVPGQNV